MVKSDLSRREFRKISAGASGSAWASVRRAPGMTRVAQSVFVSDTYRLDSEHFSRAVARGRIPFSVQ